MNKESLQSWALVFEILGGIAVIVSLTILIFQVQSNTNTMRAATYDSIVADIADWRMTFVTNSEVQEQNFILNTEGREALTPRQSNLERNLLLSFHLHMERAYIQWRAGNLGDEEWERFRSQICGPSGNPGFETTVGTQLDTMITAGFAEYRKTQCDN